MVRQSLMERLLGGGGKGLASDLEARQTTVSCQHRGTLGFSEKTGLSAFIQMSCHEGNDCGSSCGGAAVASPWRNEQTLPPRPGRPRHFPICNPLKRRKSQSAICLWASSNCPRASSEAARSWPHSRQEATGLAAGSFMYDEHTEMARNCNVFNDHQALSCIINARRGGRLLFIATIE